MNTEEYDKQFELEKSYWWFVGRKFIIESLIRRHILRRGLAIADLGCGTGAVTELLAKFGKVRGIDFSQKAVDFCRQRDLNVSLCDVRKLSFKEEFDLITAFDLLEHLDEDTLVLASAYRALKPDGLIFLSVPAHKFLWSEHDEALQHRRRYSRKELAAKVEGAGFKIERLTYALFFPFLPIFLFRTFQTLFIKSSYPKTSYILLPDWLNNFFIALLRLEAVLIRYFDLPLGVSLFCLAEKRRMVTS